MMISGFSFVRNGFDYGVPFIESIKSILPICDEFVIVVGDSTDGTREAIQAIGFPKIKIVDTVWDMNLRKDGKVFAQQTNIALDHVSGDWLFHLQADEVIHENSLDKIVSILAENKDNPKVEGFILPFFHFWGGYNYIRTSRRMHKYEVRIVRNNIGVRSYRDSQSFRKYSSKEAYEAGTEKGEKLRVKTLNDTPIYHYSFVRPPQNVKKKVQDFLSFYNGGETVQVNNVDTILQDIDRLEEFTSPHPSLMQEKVEAQDWEFVFDPKKAVWKPKDKIMQPIEDLLGFRIGGFKNYKKIR